MSARQDPVTGTWFYRFMRDGIRYFKGGYRTKKQAEDAETRFLDKLISGEIAPEAKGDDLTFKEGSQWYLDTISPTLDAYANDKARIPILQGHFKDKKLKMIDKEAVLELRSFLAKQPGKIQGSLLAPNTVNHFHALGKKIINALIENKKYRGDNPFAEAKIPTVAKGKPRFLYPAEKKQLEAEIRKDPRLWPYFYAGIKTGMREGELCNMRIEHITFPLRSIFVPETKNGKSRHVPMSDQLTSYLQELVADKQQHHYVLGTFHQNTVCRWFTEAANRCGLKGVTFHALRHTFANRLLTRGVHIYKVSKILGHSSTGVTEDTYGHMAFTDLQEAVNQIDEWQESGSEEKRETEKALKPLSIN